MKISLLLRHFAAVKSVAAEDIFPTFDRRRGSELLKEMLVVCWKKH